MNPEFYIQASFLSHGERNRRVLRHKGAQKVCPNWTPWTCAWIQSGNRSSDSSSDAHSEGAAVAVKTVVVLMMRGRAEDGNLVQHD